MNNHAETKAVKAVIENYMNGTYQADIEKLKGVFHEKAVMNGYLGPDCLLADPSGLHRRHRRFSLHGLQQRPLSG